MTHRDYGHGVMDMRTKNDATKKEIARVFKELRQRLALTPRDVLQRSNGRFVERELRRLEQGLSLLSTAGKRQAVADAYGLTSDHIAALVSGQLTVDDAVKVARISGPALAYLAAGQAPAIKEGERMATFARLGDVQRSAFPNLEICVLYHEKNGKTWSASSVAGARSGDYSKDDMTPHKWEELLNRLDETTKKIRIHPPVEKPRND
jgi:hypothetical protein